MSDHIGACLDEMYVRIIGRTPIILNNYCPVNSKNKYYNAFIFPKQGFEKELASRYHIDDKGFVCIPAMSIKRCIIDSLKGSGIAKNNLLRSLFVSSIGGTYSLIPISFSRCNIVNICQTIKLSRTGEIVHKKYNPTITKWSTVFNIKFDEKIIDRYEVLDAISSAGFSEGLGDSRPGNGGTYGSFELDPRSGTSAMNFRVAFSLAATKFSRTHFSIG